ncbi:MAG: hypothetical protein ACYDHW_12835 [Syntrophorhabdaceae bacterium]
MIKSRKLKSVDMLLLLLYSENGRPIYGRTRLQKIVFVFENEIMKQFGFDKVLKQKVGFNFLAHNYGPFSKEVFDHMDFLINVGMVNAKFSEDQNEEVSDDLDDEDILLDDVSNDPEFSPEEEDITRGYPEYLLTDSGKNYVKEKIVPFLNNKQLAAMEELKRKFNAYDLATILKYVYKKYPNMACESRIRDRILRQ